MNIPYSQLAIVIALLISAFLALFWTFEPVRNFARKWFRWADPRRLVLVALAPVMLFLLMLVMITSSGRYKLTAGMVVCAVVAVVTVLFQGRKPTTYPFGT